jgi:hypothetical protein
LPIDFCDLVPPLDPITISFLLFLITFSSLTTSVASILALAIFIPFGPAPAGIAVLLIEGYPTLHDSFSAELMMTGPPAPVFFLHL